jgi:acetylornithine deacetylase/succinyl-diaminopimelate desuccinylase-like protein
MIIMNEHSWEKVVGKGGVELPLGQLKPKDCKNHISPRVREITRRGKLGEGELESIREKVLRMVDEEEVVRLTSESVRFRSVTTDPGAEKETAAYFADRWREMGLEVQLQEVWKDRPNVVGRLRGSGDGPALMFEGHMDTDPLPNPDAWKHGPYSGDVDWEGGWVYGHGAVNDKGGLAAATAAVNALIRSNVGLKGDIILAGVMGEVSGFWGSKYMAEHGPVPDVCIVVEPTDCQIQLAHVGIVNFDIVAKGRSTHISGLYTPPRPGYHKGVNPIEKMIKIIYEMEYRLPWPQNLREVFTYKPHPLLGDPIICAGIIHAGMEGRPGNLPNECIASFDLRTVPGMSVETVKKDLENLLKKMRARDPDIDAEVRIWDRAYNTQYATVIPADLPVVQVLKKAHRAIFEREAKIQNSEPPWIYGATDATIWWNVAKVPCAVYGAGGAEGWVFPDERQNIRQLFGSSKVYALSALDICASDK